MTITSTIADRAARLMGRSTGRRSFLVKTAVAGSAAVIAGREFVLKPGTAYGAICCKRGGRSCQCGSMCCDGWTEFCCTIYGSNSCPPGSLMAGWWKVDNSSYCNGSARYYMDCNKSCGSCGCGGNGLCSGACSGAHCQCRSCGHRKDGCTMFRYGNCNNHVRCVGPIMCRVVTCTKPWHIDGGCTTATRVDNRTRYHNRPCLQAPPPPPPPPPPGPPRGQLSSVTPTLGGFRVTGKVTDPDGGQVHVQVFVDGEPVQSVKATTSGAFAANIPTASGEHEICVYAQNRGVGHPVQLGCVSRSR